MARPLRVNLEGGWYHVFARGLNGMVLFADNRDREHLLELFGETVDRYRIEIHAFALMDTHYHAVARTPDANLSRAMQWLNLGYAAWFNTRHQRKGPVFQRPFASVPVEDEAWAYELSLYVHLNPLRIKALELSKRDRQASSQGMRRPPSAQTVSERLKRLREYPCTGIGVISQDSSFGWRPFAVFVPWRWSPRLAQNDEDGRLQQRSLCHPIRPQSRAVSSRSSVWQAT